MEEFLQKIKEIDAKSLEFHFVREDFEKWIAPIIGDARLAKAIKTLRTKKVASGVDLRDRLLLLISKRLKELKNASPAPEVKKQKKKKTRM